MPAAALVDGICVGDSRFKSDSHRSPYPIQSNPIQSNPTQSNPTTLHSLLVLNYAVFVLYIAGCAYENAEADRGNGAKELRSVGRGASVDVVPEFVEQALVSMRNLQSLT
jgi:hypothetical protein